MSGAKGCFGCFAALFGIVGIFVAITISFSFYLIPVAFLLFIGCLILISLALGPVNPAKPSLPPDETDRDNKPES